MGWRGSAQLTSRDRPEHEGEHWPDALRHRNQRDVHAYFPRLYREPVDGHPECPREKLIRLVLHGAKKGSGSYCVLRRRRGLTFPYLHARRRQQDQALEGEAERAGAFCLTPKIFPDLVRFPVISKIKEVDSPVDQLRLAFDSATCMFPHLSLVTMAGGITHRMRLPARQVSV